MSTGEVGGRPTGPYLLVGRGGKGDENGFRAGGEGVRSFQDEQGRGWTATVGHRPGPDYQGRYHLVFQAEGATAEAGLSLPEIQWNSERTARRTLETMSLVELRRRLRAARGRVPKGI
jgi:hypothetical protein